MGLADERRRDDAEAAGLFGHLKGDVGPLGDERPSDPRAVQGPARLGPRRTRRQPGLERPRPVEGLLLERAQADPRRRAKTPDHTDDGVGEVPAAVLHLDDDPGLGPSLEYGFERGDTDAAVAEGKALLGAELRPGVEGPRSAAENAATGPEPLVVRSTVGS